MVKPVKTIICLLSGGKICIFFSFIHRSNVTYFLVLVINLFDFHKNTLKRKNIFQYNFYVFPAICIPHAEGFSDLRWLSLALPATTTYSQVTLCDFCTTLAVRSNPVFFCAAVMTAF